jgi:hypothetical protein
MNNTSLISKVEEVLADIGQPDCKLIKPYIIGDDGKIEPWLTDFTNNDEVMISSDKIITLVEPKKSLLDQYLEFTQ